MRKILAGLCLLLFIGGAHPDAPATPAAPISAVKVNRMKFQGDRNASSVATGGWGSGTVVESGKGKSLVLTNKHVCPDSDAFYFVLHDRRAFQAAWVGAAENADLALLRIDVELPAVEVAGASPPVGTPVRQWGCTDAGPMRFADGVTEADDAGRLDWEKRTFLRTTLRSAPGDSGAGLFDKANRLVGVTYGGPLPGSTGESWAMHVPLGSVRAFLDKHKGK